MLGERNPRTEDGAPIRRPARHEKARRAFPLRANSRQKERARGRAPYWLFVTESRVNVTAASNRHQEKLG
jgi:hypothetical protein